MIENYRLKCNFCSRKYYIQYYTSMNKKKYQFKSTTQLFSLRYKKVT